MPTTIAVHNRKGGVAKSTSTLNLAGELSALGLRVLCVDADPQASLTTFATGSIQDEVPVEQTTLAVMLPERYEADEEGLAFAAPWGGELWRASGDLAEAESVLNGTVPGPHQRLRMALRQRAEAYDVVLIDTPPSTGKCVYNALGAADFVLVPFIADQASVAGLHKMFKTFALMQQMEHPDLEVLGMFATFSESRTLHYRDSMAYVRSRFPEHLLRTAGIPKSTVVKDAALHKQTVRAFEPSSPAGEAYRDLAENLLDVLAERGVALAGRNAVAKVAA